MGLRCPKCNVDLEVRLTAAPPMQADSAKRESGGEESLRSLLERIDDDALSGMESKFVTETRARFEQYGPKTRMSEKQMAWLKKIADSAGEEQW